MNTGKLRTRGIKVPAPKSAAWAAFAALLLGLAVGCRNQARTSDPQLRPIQEMLDAQLPPGATDAKVSLYLATQGYTIEPSRKPGTIIAIIRRIDIQRLEPVTARATFYFDPNGKLKWFELQRTLNAPMPLQPAP